MAIFFQARQKTSTIPTCSFMKYFKNNKIRIQNDFNILVLKYVILKCRIKVANPISEDQIKMKLVLQFISFHS